MNGLKNGQKKNRRYLCSCYIGCGYYNHHRYGCTDRDKKGAQATSKFAKALAKVGEKVAPIIGGLLNLAAKLLTLSADAVGFLAKNLWLLAVGIAYVLYKKYYTKK